MSVERRVYCVSDARHFLGAVALINSLRLGGWRDEIVVVDCGLSGEQRRLLDREASILPASSTTPPHFQKLVGPLAYPAEVMLLLDADLVITGALEPLVSDAAETGKLVAVADALPSRFHRDWGVNLGLGPLRRQTYVNSGFLIVPAGLAPELFDQWQRAQRLVDVQRSMVGDGTADDPFYFLDQDVLNAILASGRFRQDDLRVLEYAAAPHPPFTGLRVVDETRLRVVASDGSTPLALHHIQRKPWLHPLAPNTYSRLLPRLWLAADLPLQLEQKQVPLRFRQGFSGSVGARVAAAQVAAERTRQKLGVRRRLHSRLHREPATRRP